MLRVYKPKKDKLYFAITANINIQFADCVKSFQTRKEAQAFVDKYNQEQGTLC